MTPLQSNVAYDLSTFDNRSRRENHNNVVKLVEEKKKKGRRRSIGGIAVLVSVVLAFLVVSLCSHILLNEKNAQLASLKQELDKLDGEYTALAVRYDAMVDLQSVEKLAIYEYGMGKLDKSRVQYLSVNNTDVSVKYDGNRSFLSGLPTAFRRLSAFFEYFN